MTTPTTPAHTCRHADRQFDLDPCTACDIDAIRDGIGTVSMADATAGHAALRRVNSELSRLAAKIAELETERDVVATAMAFDEGASFGPLTAACARLRIQRSKR